MNIEVKNTERRDLFDGSDFIPDEQLLHSDFDEANGFVPLSLDVQTIVASE